MKGKPLRLEGAHVLVTGGSSGIGRAIAFRCVSAGAHIHLVARRPACLAEASAALLAARAHSRQNVSYTACDVTCTTAVRALFDELKRTGFRPTLVVSSVGFSLPGTFSSLSVGDHEHMMEVNYFGMLRVLKHVVPDMVQRRRGHILNVGSMASLLGVFGFSGYCASKFAVRGFTESLRYELKPYGVWVSLLCPPDTDTPMLTAEAALKPPETAALSKRVGVLSSDRVAAAALEGVRRRQALIIPGLEARMTAWAHRLVPGLVERVSDDIIRSARRSC